MMKGLIVTFTGQILEVAMALVLKALIGGIEDKESIYEKVYEELEQLGYHSAEIEDTLEEVFSLEGLNDGILFPFEGMSHVVFDLYSPEKRIPVELMYGESDEEIIDLFSQLYSGKLTTDRFEISLESGDIEDFQGDTLN